MIKKMIVMNALVGLIADAAAQTAPQAAEQPNPLMSIAPFAIIFVIFYFLMIRPQKKKLEEEKAMLGGLNRGDEVYTKSGLLGKIVGLTEKVVTLEVCEGTKLKVLRAHIGGSSEKLFGKKEK